MVAALASAHKTLANGSVTSDLLMLCMCVGMQQLEGGIHPVNIFFKLDTQIWCLGKNATSFVILDKQDFKWPHHEVIAWMRKEYQNSFEVVIAH